MKQTNTPSKSNLQLSFKFLKTRLLIIMLFSALSAGQKSHAQTGGTLNFTNGDYVDLGSTFAAFNFGTTNFTLETWFKTSMSEGTIISKRSICNVSNFWNLRISAGKIRFEMMETGGANTVDFSTPLTYNDNTWHHVAVTRSTNIVKIFIDGYVVATNTQPGITNLNNITDPIKLGQSACNNFVGELDETRIWTEAQSTCEIFANKNYQFNSTLSTLKFNAHYNQGTAGGSNATVSSLTNSAANAIPGTLNTFALSGSSSNWVSSTCPAQGLNSAPFTIVDVDACVSYTWAGTTFTNSGTYNHIFTTSFGCDSAVQLQLTIHPLPFLNVTASDNTICSGSDGTMTVSNSTELAYCTPTFSTNNIGNDYINFFNINSVNSLTGESPSGYTYYNSVTMNASVGNTNTIQLNIDTTFSQGLAMWIDYNQDGDFDEMNEYYPFSIFSSPILGGTFTVPTLAKNGITRLRVACRRDAVPAANEYCGGFTYGEFEDYKINITGGVANTNITWSPSTFLTSTVGSTVSINNITSATTYTVTYTDAYGCTSAATESIGVNPLPQVTIVSDVSSVCGSDTVQLRNNTYCTPTVSAANVSGQHFISQFTFGSNLINNISGDGPGVYNYYSTQTANVTAGNSYSIFIGHGGTASTSKAIWIDLNHDGDFSDGGELVYSAGSGNTFVSANIGIHPTASNGLTRMRVAVSSAPSISSGESCAGFFGGEYEDYNLNISGGYNTLSWTPSTFLNTTTGGQVVANNLNATTTYTLTVTDANGCTNTDAHTITKLNVPTVTINASSDSICSGSNLTLNGAGASTYVWSNGVTNGVAFAPTATATYTVTGTSATGCTNTATKTIGVLPSAQAFSISPTMSVCTGGDIQISSTNYCMPTIHDPSGNGYDVIAQIANFNFANGQINNSSDIYSGTTYSDYTNLNANIQAGYSYPISISSPPPYGLFYAIWVDLNQNGSFETNEKLYSNSSSLNSPYSTIFIPSSAYNGKTRMRINISLYEQTGWFNNSGSYPPNPNWPCHLDNQSGISDYGEYEDYSITISGGVNHPISWSPSTYLNTTMGQNIKATNVLSSTTYTITTAASNGCSATTTVLLTTTPNNFLMGTINASASGVCPGDSVTLNGSGASQYIWSHNINNGIPFVPTTTTTYTLVGINSNGCKDTATKTVEVYSIPSVSVNAPTNCSGLPTQLSINVNYCTPVVPSNLPNRDYIDTFIFNGNAILSFTGEGPNSFNNYTNQIANVVAGNSYNFTMGIGGNVANLRAIWVDYNQDGDFTDPGEFVWSSTATLSTLNGSFTIPLSASNGLTRMRVLCASSIGGLLINTSCSNVVFGEYEDYSLKISGGVNSVVWSPSNSLIDTLGSTVQTVPLISNTNYSVIVTDSHGCTNQTSYTASVNPIPLINLSSNMNSVCSGTTIALTAEAETKFLSTNSSSITSTYGYYYWSPYPATCNISGLPISGAYLKRVFFNGFNVGHLGDLYIDLLAPNGQQIRIMDMAGYGYYLNNANIILEDNQPYLSPHFGTLLQLNSGVYAPTSYWAFYNTYPPQPTLSSFTGNLNGTWSIQVYNSNGGYYYTDVINSIQLEFAILPSTYQWTSSNPIAQAGIANPTSFQTNAIVTSNTTYTFTATDTNGCSNHSSLNITTDVPTASFNSSSGNTLCVDNANTTLSLGSSTYCIPTQANGPNQSNYYLTSFYLPDGVTSPWFISSNQDNYMHYNHIHQLTAGNNYTCTLGYNYANSYIHAWIDFNQDGDFYDNGEYLGNSIGANGNTTIPIPINIPSTAYNGYVRLRVAATNSSSHDPCGGNIFGEFEDYDLNISGGINNPNIVWSPSTNLSSANGYSVNASNIMSTTTYTVTVSDDGGCSNTSTQTITINPCGNATQANVKLFLQGYYTGSNLMTTVLSNQSQPSNSNITDTIQIELRDPSNTSSILVSSKALLNKDGNATATFSAIPKGYYYIVVKHRNGIETWSANPVLITNTTTYNFSDAANKAYGDNQSEVESGVWAIYSGDINQDGNIDLIDASLLEVDINNFEFGYFTTDINGDGNVDLIDVPIVENNINAFIYSAHP